MSTEAPAAPNPLTELVNTLKAAFQPTPAPPSASGSPMAMPATFAGDAAECSGFLLQVNLFIQMQPQMFSSENAKVAFLICKALQWAKAIWNSDNPIIHSYEQFTSHFSEVFSTTTGTLTTSDQLFRLQQGTTLVNDYTLHFRTLAAASGWNETALLGAYRQGLNPDICAAMALYDDNSGSSGNFISQDCLNRLQLPRCRHFQVLAVKTIQGKPLGRGTDYFTRKRCGFWYWRIPQSVILRRPWLQKHRPELSRGPCDIIRWSEHCQTNCLVNLPHLPSVPVLLSSTQVESPEPSFTPEIPAEYMAFQDVFSKQPPTYHRIGHGIVPSSCSLGPSSALPKGRVYPLSIPERQAMDYIAEALSQGFIQPSTSPAASSFFMGKKDGGLCPCIDYQQLNSQIRQQPYAFPLVPATLEELCGAQVFTKLDLRRAYNLVFVTSCSYSCGR
ncbi:hypothetical protein M9458_056834 [Cirrhinus mrigala]|uniref:Retrotransposon gag domain-containing protein n=1 Tax=Cirrhinus mrigala TaxID=683832 RepID=A0ABD0MCC9_CIRMR